MAKTERLLHYENEALMRHKLIQEFKRKKLPYLHKEYMRLKNMSVKEYQKYLNEEGPKTAKCQHFSYHEAKHILNIELGNLYHDYMNAIKNYHQCRQSLVHDNRFVKLAAQKRDWIWIETKEK
jgi:hypothetical protein